jgi:hypothetical protein
MTEKTGTIQTTGSLWKLMVVANAEAIVASCRTVELARFFTESPLLVGELG